MRTRGAGWLATAWTLLGALALGAPAAAGEISAELVRARDATLAELARVIPDEPPSGAVAVLPPEVPDPAKVDRGLALTWSAAFAGALQERHAGLQLAERERLEQVLREQKFADSPYADPATATQVGKLIAARTLIASRIHEFRWRGGLVHVQVEATAIDVETGTRAGTRIVERAFLPRWAKAGLALAAVALLAILWWAWQRSRRERLVETEVPAAKQEARIAVDGLARAATDARERARAAGDTAGAAALQAAWIDLDAALDRVRHALPGGAVDRSRASDLASALREAGRIGALVEDLERACTRAGTETSGLASRLRAGAGELRAAVDAYRRTMV